MSSLSEYTHVFDVKLDFRGAFKNKNEEKGKKGKGAVCRGGYSGMGSEERMGKEQKGKGYASKK